MTDRQFDKDTAATATAPIRRGDDAYDLLVAALSAADCGNLTGAQDLLDRARSLEPDNPAVLTGQAALYRRQGRLRDAVLACDAAIRAAPEYADAWLERAVVLATGGSPAKARESFARAAALDPDNPAAHAGFATLAARDGAFDDARHAAERALVLDPQNVVAAGALAAIALEEDDPATAYALLEPRIAKAGPGSDRAQALSLLGNACDRLGDHAAAFQYFTRSNQDFAAVNASPGQGRLSNTDFVEAIYEGFRAVDPGRWRSPLPAAARARNHIFLLGYPRSGTTLVENILASIPGTAALEERPTLFTTDHEFLSGQREEIMAGLSRFAEMKESALEPLRQAYWQKVMSAGVSPAIANLVDMDPLKGTRLPFIARLFPAARIVVMRRDPRDVVWSCFKTNFAIASGTLEYTTLERAARHYDALMRLTQLARERLPLAFHDVRYDHLVTDFDRTTRALCDFSGLPWSDTVRRFDRTAKTRGVATASASQVRRGLYDGRRQWEPYSRWFEPVMPILEPWIERFGYA